MKRGAILIIGQLRNWKSNSQYFHALLDRFDIFVITERSWGSLIQDKRFHVHFIDDVPQEMARHHALLGFAPPEGLKMLQWLKLGFGLQCVRAREAERGKPYSYLFKMRTDLANIEDINLDHVFEKARFYCQTDYCFAAERDTFFLLEEFCKYPEYYYQWFSPVDTGLIGFRRSDFSAARFKWLPYPAILKKLPWHILRRLLRLRISWPSNSAFSYRKRWRQIGFASEAFFLRFLLENNLSIAAIGRHPINLIVDRKHGPPLISA